MHSNFFFNFILWLMKRYKISARHFRQNRHFPKGTFGISFAFLFITWRFRRLIAFPPFSPISPLSKGPLCHRVWIFVYSLACLAINRHFWHFRRNRHFPKGPFPISFEFLLTVWRFWRLSTISAIFVKYANFANIATLQRAPLPSHLNFCL